MLGMFGRARRSPRASGASGAPRMAQGAPAESPTGPTEVPPGLLDVPALSATNGARSIDLPPAARVKAQLANRSGADRAVVVASFLLAAVLIMVVSARVISGFSPQTISSLFGQHPRPSTSVLAAPGPAVSSAPTGHPDPGPSDSGTPTFARSVPSATSTSSRPSRASDSPSVSSEINPPPAPPGDTSFLTTSTEPTPTDTPSPSDSASPSSQASTESPTTTPTPTDTTTTPPPPNPDTLPVNAPGASVHVASVQFGPDQATYRTVSVNGLVPDTSYGDVTSTFVDWGDLTTDSAPNAGPVPDGGFSIQHTYTADGTFTITWGYVSDRAHTWTHVITLDSTSLCCAPGSALDDGGVDGSTQHFAYSNVSDGAWPEWTLDYGDGTYQHGSGPDSPSADVSSHNYDGAGHTAVLTLLDSDGQLSTSPLTTP
ncbi:hypothetical protein M6D93_13650 [Jatrophihabitans telluris]|uniref:PKD domain-containing protein n=1 Tax=Jatrophihabitans telluris TaxID=2038343 RepID=A0ABY4QV98_9ACTN|nr:hypothetical protein [Jatrophihabitans telluris]UQX87338.1 hypothetical protein M6D93_13650 [Jatrophihabitans telluris]